VNRLQLQVENSPFTREQAELLNSLLPTLTETQRIWLCGYLMALRGEAVPASGTAAVQTAVPATHAAAMTAPSPAAGNSQTDVPKEVTVLYGSQTGNSERLAKELTRKLESRGFRVTLSISAKRARISTAGWKSSAASGSARASIATSILKSLQANGWSR
jgi:sulfite reductase (NADPH) flavoprotein alpha-component